MLRASHQQHSRTPQQFTCQCYSRSICRLFTTANALQEPRRPSPERRASDSESNLPPPAPPSPPRPVASAPPAAQSALEPRLPAESLAVQLGRQVASLWADLTQAADSDSGRSESSSSNGSEREAFVGPASAPEAHAQQAEHPSDEDDAAFIGPVLPTDALGAHRSPEAAGDISGDDDTGTPSLEAAADSITAVDEAALSDQGRSW